MIEALTEAALGSGHIIGALGVLAAVWFIISTLTDPLSSVPGPWHARFTGIVGDVHWIKGTKPSYIHSLHLQYGPLVRVAPREVYTMDAEDVHQIHRIKNEFPKSSWYRVFLPGPPSVFSTTDTNLHRRLRRNLSSPISESGLKAFLPKIDSRVRLAIEKMRDEHATRGAADVYKWFLFMATDIIGELSFGESFRTLEMGEANQYIKDLQSLGEGGSIRTAFPTLLKLVRVLRIPNPAAERAISAVRRMMEYSIQSLKRHKEIVEREGEDAAPTVFSKVYKGQGDETITDEEVQVNGRTYIVAGSDTTSNALDFVVWTVCRHPEVQTRLVRELEKLPEDFTYEDLKDMSYLDCVIDETLRIYPTAPAGLPREVPQGGAQLSGHHIPTGYTVTTQAYSLGRNPNAFPDPQKFDPSRWESPTQAMKDSYMPFGGGSRICLGIHLARVELRLGTARFFRAFPNAKVSTLEGMNDADMVPELFFLAGPKGRRCLIDLK